jgi:hypothetical protein
VSPEACVDAWNHLRKPFASVELFPLTLPGMAILKSKINEIAEVFGMAHVQSDAATKINDARSLDREEARKLDAFWLDCCGEAAGATVDGHGFCRASLQDWAR